MAVPRSLRRAANRKADPRGKAPRGQVVEAAAAGLLTRKNTEPGTAGRRAVDRVTYERRVAKGAAKGLSAREAAGTPGRNPLRRDISVIASDSSGVSSFVVLGDVDRRTAARIGRYDHLVRELAEGRLTGPEFQRRVGSWRPLPGGERFESNPSAVLAVIEERRASGLETFIYTSKRAA